MTAEQTGIIMDILTTAYPRFYNGPDAPDMGQTLMLWTEMFRDDDVAIVAAAVKALIASDEKGFPPHIGAVKKYIRVLTDTEEMTELEAWRCVSKALRNSTYGAKEEFAKLPPIVKKLVGSPEQMRTWGMMESDTVHSVVASNFQRSYKIVSAREREFAKLPQDVKDIAQQIADQKRMDALPEHREDPRKNVDDENDPVVPCPVEKLRAAMRIGTGRSKEEVLAYLRGKE